MKQNDIYPDLYNEVKSLGARDIEACMNVATVHPHVLCLPGKTLSPEKSIAISSSA